MKLIKYDNVWNDPIGEFENIFGRMFADRGLLPAWFTGADEGLRGFRMDTFANDEGYQLVAELPGIPKEAIDIKLENSVLTISGAHSSGEGDNKRSFKFSRSVTVGDDVNADGVSAKLENGLLTVNLPKAEERKPRAITVN